MVGESNSRSGFTLIEILVSCIILSIIAVSVPYFFTQGVRSTMKGQDNLETIRAASALFADLRKDLLACESIVVVPGASITLGIGASCLPEIPSNADTLAFCFRGATVTYAIETNAEGKKFVNRVFVDDHSKRNKEFAVPRVKSFKAMQIWKTQQIFPANPFLESQLLVTLEIDSMDKRFPTKYLKLSSFFISNQMSSSHWNYFY